MYVFAIYYSDGSLRTHDRVTTDLQPHEARKMMWRKYGISGFIHWIATEEA